jgi:hypothetical protein
MKDFVQTVRAVESILGIGTVPNYSSLDNITVIMQKAAEIGDQSDEIKSVRRYLVRLSCFKWFSSTAVWI